MLPFFHAVLRAIDAQVNLRIGTGTVTCISTCAWAWAWAWADTGTRANIRHSLAEQKLFQWSQAAEWARHPWYLRGVHSFTGYGP